jgi:chromosome segregation ATPase
MAKIYQTFNELLTQNRGLFKLVSKSKNPGLLNAIWESRTPEIEALKKNLEAIWNENSELANELAHTHATLNSTRDELAQTQKRLQREENIKEGKSVESSFFQEELQVSKEKRSELEIELAKARHYITTLERVTSMKEAELNHANSQLKTLSDNLSIAHTALLTIDQDLQHARSEALKERNEREKSENKLKEEGAMVRQYKQLNFKMSNEMYRLERELEKTHGYN